MTTLERGDLRRQSTAELIRTLSEQASRLVHQEIELAKAELGEKGRGIATGAALLAVAGVAALLTLGSLTAFLVLALDGVMPAWLAALCVTLLWALVGVAFALYGRQKLETAGTPVPEKTLETVKEDIEWLKHPTS
jgi:uncharacterized membrane protein YqjE